MSKIAFRSAPGATLELSEAFCRLDSFQRTLEYAQLPEAVRNEANRCLIDLVGVASAGRTTPNAAIVAEHVAETYGAGRVGARILFDGRKVSQVGAAMAGAAMIDSLDGHDGHKLAKGHAGVVVLPTLLSGLDAYGGLTGAQFLTRFVIGYEVAVRAAIALHASAPDYHSSGAWNALGAVAALAGPMGLTSGQLREALGTAEYYGPRSQMMRCIDFPTMVKDGATMGAHVGVSAVLLARRGFTGAPALTLEAAGLDEIWADLGTRWLMAEQYLKPWPVCRWAQPAIAAAAALYPRIAGAALKTVTITTFHEAARLAARAPASTEAAQYSLPFPVAAMLVHGEVDAKTVTGRLDEPAILALAARIKIGEDEAANRAFPQRRLARLAVELADGRHLETEFIEAPGDPDTRLSEAAIETKFYALARPGVGEARAEYLLQTSRNLANLGELTSWTDALFAPLERGPMAPH